MFNLREDIRTHVQEVRDFLLDILFPIECLSCGEEGEWLCPECEKKLKINTNHQCPECKQTGKFGVFCQDCKPKTSLDGLWIAGDYQDQSLAHLIKKYKYHFIKDLHHILARFLFRHILSLKNEILIKNISKSSTPLWQSFKNLEKAPPILFSLEKSYIIPIPLHAKRLRWRGFNQSELLAHALSQKFSATLVNDCLVRIRHTKAQAKLKKKDRLKNLKNSFSCRYRLKNKDIIIIDDVTSTGTTLNECAKILKQAGAKTVWGLVIARG